MELSFRAGDGARVVVLGGAGISSLRAWLAEIDIGALRAREGAADGVLMDFRAPGLTPGAREANALITALIGLCAERVPPVAILANPGAQYGGARMLCTLGELRGCRAAAFRDEAEAWAWLRGCLAGGRPADQVSA